jgi:hypothetical protein
MQAVVRLVVFLVTLAIVSALPTALAQERSRPSIANPSLSQGSPPSPKPNEQRVDVTFKDGRLSVNAQNRPLARLANEISEKAGVAVVLAEGVGKEPINLSFRDLPLDEGLRRILKDHDTFFFFGVEKEPPASVRAVWVYSKGKGRGLAPIPSEVWASTKELEGMVADPDPKVRLQAVLALIDRKGDKAQDLVLEALKDQDNQVRSETLYRAFGKGVELPADALTELALNDPSPDVRVLALDALAKDPNVRSLAEHALGDPSPQVQNKAREIMAFLDSAAERPAPVQGQPAPPN